MTPELKALLPLLVIGATILAVMLADTFVPPGRRVILAVLSGLGVAVAMVAALLATQEVGPARLFHDTVAVDAFSLFFDVLFLGLALLVLMLAPGYLERRGIHVGEFYVLLLCALAGMMVLAAATSLMTVFIGVELLSIALYVLSGFLRSEERSQEAALKYLLIGGFASGFLLYGMALLYGATGSTSIPVITAALPHLAGDNLAFAVMGIALVMVGLAYKASAAPFHTWTPDVYEGAPAPVVAFMSVGTKVAAVAAFLRVFVAGLAPFQSRWAVMLGGVAAISMLVGAVGALRQINLKRLLAYSSIAHAGYLLLAVVAGGRAGLVSGAFYLGSYALMTFGAFGVVTLLAGPGEEGLSLNTLRGLGYRIPAAGALMALFMLSLAGFPPTVGFMGKLFVFEAVIGAGYAPLAVVAVTSSVISIYYYLKVVAVIYTRPESPTSERTLDPWGMAAVGFVGILTLVLGVFPSLLYDLAQKAATGVA